MSQPLFLGVEIGGTKLQWAVGSGGELLEVHHRRVQAEKGAQGILDTLAAEVPLVLQRYRIAAVGVGFGGPVWQQQGRVITSHQIAGWDDFPLKQWFQEHFGLPTLVANDCDTAAVAESRFGAGRGCSVVFYITVGSGIGGGLVLEGRLYQGHGPAVAEVGHLRPGTHATEPEQTVESLASGWGMAQQAARLLRQHPQANSLPLWQLCQGQPEKIQAEQLFQVLPRDPVAQQVVQQATTVLGWAVAQVVTLLAPEVVVLGGGVSQAPKQWFLEPVEQEARQFVFPPLRESFRVVRAQLGQQVVLHGAVALAQDALCAQGN